MEAIVQMDSIWQIWLDSRDMAQMISLYSLLLEQVILHIMHLKLKSWQWRRIQMECLSSRIMRQTAIFPFWREKVMNIIRWRVMSTRIMDYDFSGMHSEIKIQEDKGDDLC